jgi:2,4-dienoyl-CoA reductase-like NADH-dependent reductase (Old Yellow Enzyme family)
MSEHGKFRYETLEELEADARALGLGIEFSRDLGVLSKPVQLGVHRAPNSLAVHPVEGRDADSHGRPGRWTFRRYERYARGGAGLIWFEATGAGLTLRSNESQLALTRDNQEGFEKLLNATRKAAEEEFGSSHKPVCIIQLQDSGRHRVGAGTIPGILFQNPYWHYPPGNYPILTDSEIESLEDTLADAAVLAWRIGFDGADIKSCHGYLGSDFLSAYTREGKYGGTFEGRTRFLLNVVDRVRQHVSKDFLVTVRLNLYDGIPYPYGWGVNRDDAMVPDLTEPIQLAKILKQWGVHIISASNGIPEHNLYLIRPYDAPVMGGESPKEQPLECIAKVFKIVGDFQRAHPDIVVVGSAYSWLRQFFSYAAAGNLKRGLVSMVGLGRMTLAYPDFARDLMESGRLDPDRVCNTCDLCGQLFRWGGPVGCVVRDKEIYEPIYRRRGRERGERG